MTTTIPTGKSRMINNVPLHQGLHDFDGMCIYLECKSANYDCDHCGITVEVLDTEKHKVDCPNRLKEEIWIIDNDMED